MSEKSTTQNESEEVDLGQLFNMIGNLFTRFFNFIGSILKVIFDVLLLALIHFNKNFSYIKAFSVLIRVNCLPHSHCLMPSQHQQQ